MLLRKRVEMRSNGSVNRNRRIARLLIILSVSGFSVFAIVHGINWSAERHLHESIVEGNLRVASGLMEMMPWLSRSAQDGEPLTHSAIRQGNREAVVLLIRHGADVDIFCAAFLGDLESIRSLVAGNSAVLGDRFFGGLSALNAAVLGGNTAAVEVLIELGASVDGSGVSGWTPLRQAVYEGKDDIARLLLSNGATGDIFIYSGLGDSYDVSKHLDLSPTEVNAQDLNNGFTPLHWAAHRGRTEMVRLLLERGARTDIWEPYEVGTPSTVAQKAGHEDVLAILRDAGAE